MTVQEANVSCASVSIQQCCWAMITKQEAWTGSRHSCTYSCRSSMHLSPHPYSYPLWVFVKKQWADLKEGGHSIFIGGEDRPLQRQHILQHSITDDLLWLTYQALVGTLEAVSVQSLGSY